MFLPPYFTVALAALVLVVPLLVPALSPARALGDFFASRFGMAVCVAFVAAFWYLLPAERAAGASALVLALAWAAARPRAPALFPSAPDQSRLAAVALVLAVPTLLISRASANTATAVAVLLAAGTIALAAHASPAALASPLSVVASSSFSSSVASATSGGGTSRGGTSGGELFTNVQTLAESAPRRAEFAQTLEEHLVSVRAPPNKTTPVWNALPHGPALGVGARGACGTFKEPTHACVVAEAKSGHLFV